MKTLNLITLLVIGLFSINSAFSISASDLPYDRLTSLKADNPIQFVNIKKVRNVIVPDNTRVSSKLMTDTILIDLSNLTVFGPFPGAARECIMEQVPYPDFARENQIEGGVAVRFLFDESGIVHVLEASSNSAELEHYVRERLSNLQLNKCVVDINKDYYLRFIFRLF